MKRWVRGSEVPITIPIRDSDPSNEVDDGTLIDIDSVTINVWDRAGTQQVIDQAASKPSTGYYRYFADTTGWALGTCHVEATLTASSRARIIKGRFVLIEEQS